MTREVGRDAERRGQWAQRERRVKNAETPWVIEKEKNMTSEGRVNGLPLTESANTGSVTRRTLVRVSTSNTYVPCLHLILSFMP